jgi:predicted acylesterase/phospholipase RssA
MVLVDIIKKKIQFILPGGGVNGCFQAGFLYRLFKDYKDYIEIERIDGISVGALNGICVFLEDIEMLKNVWFNIEERGDLFLDHESTSEYWYKGCLYNNSGLKKTVETYSYFVIPELMPKFNCVVQNLDTKNYEYKNGMDENIWDYIIASASPPIITQHSKIGNNFYADGCIGQIYPTDTICDNVDMVVIIGYYETSGYYLFNLFKMFKQSISDNVQFAEKLIEEKKVIPVYNPCKNYLIDFRRSVIEEGFELGEKAAIEFFNNNVI